MKFYIEMTEVLWNLSFEFGLYRSFNDWSTVFQRGNPAVKNYLKLSRFFVSEPILKILILKNMIVLIVIYKISYCMSILSLLVKKELHFKLKNIYFHFHRTLFKFSFIYIIFIVESISV